MSDPTPSTNPAIGWTDEHGTYHHAPGYEPKVCWRGECRNGCYYTDFCNLTDTTGASDD